MVLCNYTWCFCHLNFDRWISILGLIISFITLILGWFAYNRFLLKQFRERQLGVVCDLISQINNDDNRFVFSNVKSKPSSLRSNLFDIAELYEKEQINLYFFSEGVDHLVPWGDFQREFFKWNFYSNYYNHPLLPNSIAKILRRFNMFNHIDSKVFGEVKKEERYVVIGIGPISDQHDCLIYHHMKTWHEFIKLCKSLRDAIIEWAEEHGIKDMNISSSRYFNPQ